MTRGRRCRRTHPTAALPAGAILVLVLAAAAAVLTAPAHPGWAGAGGAAESGPLRSLQLGLPLAAALRSGDPAPEAVLETLAGDHVRVSQLRGKAVLLDFWATWCGPCIAALPSLQQLAQAHADRPFALVSISGDSNRAGLRAFVAKHEMGWTQCWDGNSDAQRAYGVLSFPTYFVIDPAGRIVYVKTGWGRGAEQELGRQVDRALAAGAETRKAAAAAGR